MEVQKNIPLGPLTSFGVGGNATTLIRVSGADELAQALAKADKPIYILGYGSNSLISDRGLDGTVICTRSGSISIENEYIIAEAGAWWDDIVRTAVENNLWGVELMGEIPGSFGASLFINITAYGQSLGNLVVWVEVWDTESKNTKTIQSKDLKWGYKKSIFQDNPHHIILRACLRLSSTPTMHLEYQKALDVADELSLDPNTLSGRRAIIHEARKRAGSLLNDGPDSSKTVGSFFRNPIVDEDTAERVMSFDETGKTRQQIQKMNQVHGGSTQRVSAAHVMLAAGFQRGQTWGNVKLNDRNLLKIEALPGATAQEIYDVAMMIQETCQKKLGVTLEPEARILGDFA